MILKLNNDKTICSFTHMTLPDGDLIVRDREVNKLYMVVSPVKNDDDEIVSDTIIALEGTEEDKYGKLLRSAMLQTLSREDMLSLQGMVLLFHLQSDRDLALMPKEGYDILRDSILYDLFDYLEMYPNNLSCNWYDIDNSEIGLSIRYTYEGNTYTLDYGYATLSTTPYPSNDEVKASVSPKSPNECDRLIGITVRYKMSNKHKVLSIGFTVVNEDL